MDELDVFARIASALERIADSLEKAQPSDPLPSHRPSEPQWLDDYRRHLRRLT